MLWPPLLLLLQLLVARSQRTGPLEDIRIAGFFPMTSDGEEGALGQGVMPAVELAVKHVNMAPDILPNIRLHVTWNDTQVSPDSGSAGVPRSRPLSHARLRLLLWSQRRQLRQTAVGALRLGFFFRRLRR